MIGVKMGWAGETCRRQKAFWRFVRNRQDDVRSRRDFEGNFPLNGNGIDPFLPESLTATEKDFEQRVIFERERYAMLVFSGKPMPSAMARYGRNRLDQITSVIRRTANSGGLKRAA